LAGENRPERLKRGHSIRLIAFRVKDTGDAPHLGALEAEGAAVIDFEALRGLPVGQGPDGFLEWLDLDQPWLARARELLDSADEGARRPLDAVTLLAPVPRPGKIVCVGLNYGDHVEETGAALPARPILFSKFTTSVLAPGGAIQLPPSSDSVDFEAELGVVIGRRAKGVKAEHALEHALGYVNFNDVSARDFQFGDKQWQRGKSCDTFAPFGPFIVTRDEVADPQRLDVTLRLNGQLMQSSNTSRMIFGVARLIEFITETITLEPGDLIATGTPPGVGFARKPPVFLKDGDMVEVEVEGLGVLRNPVVKGTR
jgi:2-keto-4-pentenoate hydratase/2-oxohepta-3-ene-1,7-dioic acid hydratase in catechol pathway